MNPLGANLVWVAVLCSVLAGCQTQRKQAPLIDPLRVVHTQSDNPPQGLDYPHVWYYRTEVHNLSDRPLKIVWFEAYELYDGKWYPGNVRQRALRGEDFTEWFTEGVSVVNGVIPEGGVAVCDANWHGGDEVGLFGIKWAFIAVDEYGNDYFTEAVVDPGVLTYLRNQGAMDDRGMSRRSTSSGTHPSEHTSPNQ